MPTGPALRSGARAVVRPAPVIDGIRLVCCSRSAADPGRTMTMPSPWPASELLSDTELFDVPGLPPPEYFVRREIEAALHRMLANDRTEPAVAFAGAPARVWSRVRWRLRGRGPARLFCARRDHAAHGRQLRAGMVRVSGARRAGARRLDAAPRVRGCPWGHASPRPSRLPASRRRCAPALTAGAPSWPWLLWPQGAMRALRPRLFRLAIRGAAG